MLNNNMSADQSNNNVNNNNTNTMTNLTTFNQDGIEIIINTATGESFCSIKGYARLSGKDKSTISRRVSKITQSEGVASDLIISAEIQTAGGIQGVVLITEDLITDWILDDNIQIAKQLLKAGVRMFLHTAAGYEVSSTAIEKPKALYPDRSNQYKELHQQLKDLLSRNGGQTHHYIKLEQALNRTVGKPEGRTNQFLSEAENLAFCLAMEHALDVALKVEALNKCNKVVLTFIDGRLDGLKGHIQQIKLSLIGLEAGTKVEALPATKVAVLDKPKAVKQPKPKKARKPRKVKEEFMPEVGSNPMVMPFDIDI